MTTHPPVVHVSNCLCGGKGAGAAPDTRPGCGFPYLVLVCRTHALNDFLGFGLGNATLLDKNLAQDGIYLASHVRGIATNVKVRLLL
jgi:hypothetical protein